MPERKIKGFQIDCSEVQGEGAYAHFRRPTYEHIKMGQEAEADTNVDAALAMVEVITMLLDDWNWVDDLGNPLPLPSEDENVIRNLPWQEQIFLINEMGKINQEEEKN